MKTKRGFFEYNNGYIHLFILEEDEKKFLKAIKRKNMIDLCQLAALEHDSSGKFVHSKWPMVKTKRDLIFQVKRMRLDSDEKNI